jgi:hypothetical protein
MEDFKDLKVWRKAHELTLIIYEETRSFPRDEIYGLRSQLRRAAASIGANVAEGCGRRSDAEMKSSYRLLAVRLASSNAVSCWRGIWTSSNHKRLRI